MNDKKFYWVKTESKDFFSGGMQVLKMHPNKEKLFYLYMSLFYESIDDEGIITQDNMELLAMLFADMDFENSIKLLEKFKLLEKKDNFWEVCLVAKRIETIKESSLERKKRRTKKDKSGQKRTMSTSVQTKADKSGQCPQVSENVLYKEKIREDKRREDKIREDKNPTKEIKDVISVEEVKKQNIPSVGDAVAVVDYYNSCLSINNIKNNGSREKALKIIGQGLYSNPALLQKYSSEELIAAINNYFFINQQKRFKVENFFSNGTFVSYLSKNFKKPKTKEEIDEEEKEKRWERIENNIKNRPKEMNLTKEDLKDLYYGV